MHDLTEPDWAMFDQLVAELDGLEPQPREELLQRLQGAVPEELLALLHAHVAITRAGAPQHQAPMTPSSGDMTQAYSIAAGLPYETRGQPGVIGPCDQNRHASVADARGTSLADDPLALQHGHGRYRYVKPLAVGGMGEVHVVRDLQFDREVALKQSHGDQSAALRQRFLREAQITGQLQHPSIVPVHELGFNAAGEPFFTMKRVVGTDLAELLRGLRSGDRRLEQDYSLLRRLSIFIKVCDAVAFAHAHGVIHRDLKPANILVGDYGEVLVVDWGLARSSQLKEPQQLQDSRSWCDRDDGMTRPGEILGTLAYMAPEQARGDCVYDPRIDVYALGAILYELLALQPCFEGPSSLLLERVRHGIWDPPSKRAQQLCIPWELECVVGIAMAKQAAERFASVEELRDQIEAFVEGRWLSRVRYNVRQRLYKWASQHSGKLLSFSLLLGLTLCFGLILFFERQAALSASESARLRALDDQSKILRLSDSRLVANLRADATAILAKFPVRADWGQYLAACSNWLERATALRRRAAEHRAELASLRSRPQSDDVEQQWRVEMLEQLLAALVLLEQDRKAVVTRSELCHRWWQHSMVESSAAWARLARELAVDARYPQTAITPQPGLVPLGPDPESGLWEFAHLATGAVPTRDSTGQLQLDEASAVVLVLIPPGAFLMGSSPVLCKVVRWGVVALSRQEEWPLHQVELAAFMIAKHELTQAQWTRVVGKNPSRYAAGKANGVEATNPVESVTWYECVTVLCSLGLVLPSEAQWERAARAGTTTQWWTGDDLTSLAGAANLADQTYRRLGGKMPNEVLLDDGCLLHGPVGSLRANPFGLHDVIGNVREWCLDRYADDAYRYPVSGPRALREFVSPADQPVLVCSRGGDWRSLAVDSRCAYRGGPNAQSADPTTGVRPVWLVQTNHGSEHR
jgi:serine/threonine protein kinase/formylglycine-generating enzyme required for sulfatase activity